MPAIEENKDFPSGKVTRVMGIRVDAAAWQRFNDGQIDITAIGPRPYRFKTLLAELCYKLGEVAEHVKDSSLANFFAKVKENLEDQAEAGKLSESLVDIATKALNAAGMPLGSSK